MKFTSYDGKSHRIDRLIKAMQIAMDMMAITEMQANILIDEVSDQKGVMVVRWNAMPSPRQRECLGSAWEHVGEDRDRVRSLFEIAGTVRAA